jgi:hypothetical protein
MIVVGFWVVRHKDLRWSQETRGLVGGVAFIIILFVFGTPIIKDTIADTKPGRAVAIPAASSLPQPTVRGGVVVDGNSRIGQIQSSLIDGGIIASQDSSIGQIRGSRVDGGITVTQDSSIGLIQGSRVDGGVAATQDSSIGSILDSRITGTDPKSVHDTKP